tara:strand:- start:147 stop:1034 length:888 start_codon:yes stop_codon:yes gene_type:complete
VKNQLAGVALLWALFMVSCGGDPNTAISFDNTSISYSESGRGAPALVFVHGWCTNKSYWDNQVEYFKGKHKVITIDLAGHGMSGSIRRNWTPVNFARDVTAVINELNLKDVVLIGHSISEEVIVRAARMEPKKIKALIGVENFKDVDLEFNDSIQQEADRFFELMDRNFGITAELYANDFLFAPFTSAEVRNRVIKDVKAADPKVAIPILKLLYTDYQEDIRFLKQMVAPIHIINSSYWPTDTAALGVACPLGYSIRFMDQVGHYPMIEKPERFNQILEETLKDIEEDQAKAKNS